MSGISNQYSLGTMSETTRANITTAAKKAPAIMRIAVRRAVGDAVGMFAVMLRLCRLQ